MLVRLWTIWSLFAVEPAHVVAVDEVDRAVLAGADHLVRVGAALVGEQQNAAGAEVEVRRVEVAWTLGEK